MMSYERYGITSDDVRFIRFGQSHPVRKLVLTVGNLLALETDYKIASRAIDMLRLPNITPESEILIVAIIDELEQFSGKIFQWRAYSSQYDPIEGALETHMPNVIANGDSISRELADVLFPYYLGLYRG